MAGFQTTVLPMRRRSGAEIACDGGEVEGGNGENEPFQGAVFKAVESLLERGRLIGVDSIHEIRIETPEIDQFTGRVDFRLMTGFCSCSAWWRH